MATKRQRRLQEEALAKQAAVSQAAEFEKPAKFKKTIDFRPKTENQSILYQAIKESEVTAAMGPAGVGKTYVVATAAAQMILNNEVDKIILSRANVTRGPTIGMLPGTVEEKMGPLLAPILNALKRQLGEPLYEYMLRKKKIEMLPIEYVRGLSFLDSFVIIDEGQNLEEDDVVALATRYESGKVVIMGDPFQHDLKGVEPGISWLARFNQKYNLNIPVVNFELEDIVRSSFVKRFLIALYQERAKAKTQVKTASLLKG